MSRTCILPNDEKDFNDLCRLYLDVKACLFGIIRSKNRLADD